MFVTVSQQQQLVAKFKVMFFSGKLLLKEEIALGMQKGKVATSDKRMTNVQLLPECRMTNKYKLTVVRNQIFCLTAISIICYATHHKSVPVPRTPNVSCKLNLKDAAIRMLYFKITITF